MAYGEVEAAMKHFQRTYGKPEDVVDELFEAATDRLWALTSKEEGTFEFEVLSLREYFAARYLYRYAGEGDPRFDRTLVFRELLRRPLLAQHRPVLRRQRCRLRHLHTRIRHQARAR